MPSGRQRDLTRVDPTRDQAGKPRGGLGRPSVAELTKNTFGLDVIDEQVGPVRVQVQLPPSLHLEAKRMAYAEGTSVRLMYQRFIAERFADERAKYDA